MSVAPSLPGLLLLLLVPASGVHAWPSVPLPEGSRGELVSSHMKVNGLDMRASRFSAPHGLDEVRECYRQAWDGRMLETEFNGKTILSQGSRTHLVTVELESLGSVTQGTIGITQVPSRNYQYEMGEGFARPANTDVVSDIIHLDTPNEARSLTMYNPYTPYVNQQFYYDRLRPQGWEISQAEPCRSQSSQCAARFEKTGGGRMTVTMRKMPGHLTEVMVLIE